MYKVKRDYYTFKSLFDEKIVKKKYIHLENHYVQNMRVKLSKCLGWDIPLIFKTDRPNKMLSDICNKFSQRCFDSCFYCRFYKVFCIHFFRLKDKEIYKVFSNEPVVRL